MKKFPAYLEDILLLIAEGEVDERHPDLLGNPRQQKIDAILHELKKDTMEQMTAKANPSSPRARVADREFDNELYNNPNTTFGAALRGLDASQREIVRDKMKAAIMTLVHLVMIYNFKLRPTRRIKTGSGATESQFNDSDFEYKRGDSGNSNEMVRIEKNRYYRLITSAVVHAMLIPVFKMDSNSMKDFFNTYLSGLTAHDLREKDMRLFMAHNAKDAMMPRVENIKVVDLLKSEFDKKKDRMPKQLAAKKSG